MSRAIVTVWKKEMRDAMRDRRSFMAAMGYAFFGPILMAIAFFFLIEQLSDRSAVAIDIEGAESAPNFAQFLTSQDIIQRQQAWPQGQQPITLSIPETWQSAMADGESVEVILRADFSAQKQRSDIERVQRAVQAYSTQVASMRLLMRGIEPQLVSPLTLQKQDLATAGSRAAMIMGSVLVFIILSVFWSGMNVAIDISAGERERHSLEFLLAQPLSSQALVWGKALTASTFALFGALLSLTIIPIVFSFVPLAQIGISMTLTAPMLLSMFLQLIPLALLATALQLFVSFRAKNFKEAQTYISFLLMVPMLAVFGVEFARIKSTVLAYLPLTGQHQAFLSLIRGEALNTVGVLVSALLTLVLSVGLLSYIGRMLKSEKTVFGL
ncbi:ABC transporter permease [Idiomarina xiamenensis]|uniref:Na+ ABC transporter permease n=1 Tax=Idiomarina xiamenensis 10-D-4 TaxID=740709 RepID=K2JP66_9GAMM|nr:ABC transporter permease subunit [Idiomarina xiamenensis]EKE85286.1 Na+ ABC transporter permease [Idiomarina xiamenensis 10-D-4]